MTQQIRTLLPPGGFSHLVGHYVAALDVGSEYTRREASRAGEDAPVILRALGEFESLWIHQAVGGVPTPDAPEGGDLEAWLGWLDAVRTVSIMVLRPLQDRDLERLIHVPGEDAPPRTLKRLLAELLFLQGRLSGRLTR